MEDDAQCASLPKFTELEDDAEYAFLPKLIELVKKRFNLTRIGKEKFHCPISHSLAYFVEPDGQPRFCFSEALAGLTDGLAIGGAESRGEEVAVSYSG